MAFIARSTFLLLALLQIIRTGFLPSANSSILPVSLIAWDLALFSIGALDHICISPAFWGSIYWYAGGDIPSQALLISIFDMTMKIIICVLDEPTAQHIEGDD